MAFANNCWVTAGSSGAADFSDGTAVTGNRDFTTALTDGELYYYRAETQDRSEWETGSGIYTTTGDKIARTTIYESSNAGSKVTFSEAPLVSVQFLAQSVGTGAGQLVQLTSASKLPAVDGSLLTGISSGGLTQIGSPVSTTSGTTAEITSIPATYSELVLTFDGVSSDTAGWLDLYVSNDNGTTYSAAKGFIYHGATAYTIRGDLVFFGYTDDGCTILNGIAEHFGTGLSISNAYGGQEILSVQALGGIDAIKIVNRSGNFDAGSITLYGRV